MQLNNQHNPFANTNIDLHSAIVLVVDDNPTTAEFLVLALQPHYRAFSAFSGEDAIGFCVTHIPDLVILDLHMQGLDGLLTCKMLKTIPGMENCPIVFATADTSDQQELKCWDAGATDFVNKPFEISRLVKRVGAHIKTKIEKDRIENKVFVDQQTGLYNRRYFNECLDKQVSLAQINDGPLSLVLFELSKTPDYLNCQSYKVSQANLSLIAELISNNLPRPSDTLTRYAETQFAIIMPDTYIFGAKHIIQNVLDAFANIQGKVDEPDLKIYAGLASLNALPKHTMLHEQAEKSLAQNKLETTSQFSAITASQST